jgi:hypothetical protein
MCQGNNLLFTKKFVEINFTINFKALIMILYKIKFNFNVNFTHCKNQEQFVKRSFMQKLMTMTRISCVEYTNESSHVFMDFIVLSPLLPVSSLDLLESFCITREGPDSFPESLYQNFPRIYKYFL